MWVFGAPTMSASITQLDNSHFARRQGLDTLYLQIATVSKKGESQVHMYYMDFHPIYHTLEFGLCHTDGICPGHSAGLHAPT